MEEDSIFDGLSEEEENDIVMDVLFSMIEEIKNSPKTMMMNPKKYAEAKRTISLIAKKVKNADPDAQFSVNIDTILRRDLVFTIITEIASLDEDDLKDIQRCDLKMLRSIDITSRTDGFTEITIGFKDIYFPLD